VSVIHSSNHVRGKLPTKLLMCNYTTTTPPSKQQQNTHKIVTKPIPVGTPKHTMKLAVAKLFPNKQILEMYRHPDILYPPPLNQNVELDIYLPDLKLAFEYYGEHHYKGHHIYGPAHVFQARDEEKVELAKAKGVTIVGIPYWWNRSSESLAATISKLRPDLINHAPDATPIPSERTTKNGGMAFFKKHFY
jgi:hypothetical protein